MVRVRKLVLAIAAASALNAGSAYALGLGELSLQSALNQPLVAEIELLQVRDLEQIEIRPSLASAEEFNKAGVDRQFFLTDLTFTPVVRPNGKSVIRVTSSKPVREPYLNFLMEVVWPNGRLLREYTLLVDPPLYTPTPVIATPSRLPAVATSSTSVRNVAPTPAARPTANTPTAPARPAAPAASSLAGSEYRTTNRDTLWEIAQRVSPGSVHQTMLAIQDLNPDAFIGGNINRLKTGQVLRLPTEEQIRQRSQRDAVAQVAAQNSAWREGRAPLAGERQLDATKRTSAGAAPAQAQATDNLRLVAADAGSSTAGSETGSEQVKALNDKLAVTQESLDSSRRENADLQGQVQSLESQLEKLERLLEIRNNQLAQLEADLRNASTSAAPTPVVAEETVQAVVAPEAVAPVVAEMPAVEAPEATVQETVTEAVAQTEPAPVAEVPAEVDFNYSEEPVQVEQPAQAVVPVTTDAESVSASSEAAKPQPAPVAQTSLVDDLLSNQLLMGVVGGAAILLLLGLLMFLSRRNAKREAEMQELMQQEEESGVDTSLDFSASNFEGFDELTQAQATAGDTAQSADPLGEADIYIAYGKFSQAAELLQNAINDEPQRTDLRLKLMEVYAELDDREGFAREENELREIGASSAQLDQLKAKFPNLLAVSGVAAAAATVATAASLDDFNFDHFDLNAAEQPSPAPEATLDDSFGLGLDDVLVNEPAQSPELDDFASLSLDAALASEPEQNNPAFDLDLSFEATEKAALAEAETALDDFSFDLNESSKVETTAADENLLGALDDDFALDLNADLGAEPAAATEQALADLEADLAGFDMPSDFDLSVPDETPVASSALESDSFLAELDQVTEELEDFSAELSSTPVVEAPQSSAAVADLAADDDFDFLSGTDETATKLDLARAYIDMGDSEGAKDILDEVLSEGNETQQTEARELLAGLS